MHQQVASGLNATADAAIASAVRLLDEQDRQRHWLRTTMETAAGQVNRGEVVEPTDAFLVELDREVTQRLPLADVLAWPVLATQASQGLLRWRQEDTEMSLTITLTPQVEHRIRDLIESGHYPDADAVIQKALQALAEQEHARFLKTRELVLAGLNGGEGEELTPELWDRLEREAEEDERLGLPIRDEVKP